jgi:hypothetical protein
VKLRPAPQKSTAAKSDSQTPSPKFSQASRRRKAGIVVVGQSSPSATCALNFLSAEYLLCGAEARGYLQTVDEMGAIELKTRGEWKNYLLTTLLIEERATAIYPLYERILKQNSIPNAIGSVIRDEGAHLAAIRSEIARKLIMAPATLD